MVEDISTAKARPDGSVATDESLLKATDLEKNFAVSFNEPLPHLSTDFAKAYAVTRKARQVESGRSPRSAYALVFERSFPPRVNMINFLRNAPNEEGFFLSVLESGVIHNKNTGAENLVVIIERPVEKKLSELFINAPASDKLLINNIIRPINEFIGSLAENRLMHGTLNADNIFFDATTEKIVIGDCLFGPCGFNQPMASEPIERAVCHPMAKGDGNVSADFYALGMVILFLITGKKPLPDMSAEEMLERRFEVGSFALFTQGSKLSTFILELLKGLLSDSTERRWGYMQVDSWIRKKLSSTPSSLMREAMRGFIYGEKEYFGIRHLAYVIAKDVNYARHNLKPGDLSRWIKHSVLQPELAEKFDLLTGGKHSEAAILDEDEIARIVTLLDSAGPLRHGGIMLDIYGFGPFLADAYARDNRDSIQLVGNMLTSGLLQFWLDAVELTPEQEDARYQDLTWIPGKVLKLVRKSALGFGMERALYEMNPTLPCQSPLLGNEYVDDLKQLLHTLDHIAKEKYGESDPVDRHIAAFIATKIDLREEIILRKLIEFSEFANNPQINMLALLLAAQTAAKTKSLKGLSAWVSERLLLPMQSIKSQNIRDEVVKNIRRAAREGNLQEIYRLSTNATHLKRDKFGFKEAGQAYQQLAEKIIFVGRNENNERLAYEHGLKLALILSYLICAGTLLYLLCTL